MVELFAAIRLVSGYPSPAFLPEVHSLPQFEIQRRLCQGRRCRIKAYYHPQSGVIVDESLDFQGIPSTVPSCCTSWCTTCKESPASSRWSPASAAGGYPRNSRPTKSRTVTFPRSMLRAVRLLWAGMANAPITMRRSGRKQPCGAGVNEGCETQRLAVWQSAGCPCATAAPSPGRPWPPMGKP